MLGSITSDQKCELSGSSFIDNGRSLVCPKHKNQHATRMRVRLKYNAEIVQARSTDYQEASRFLNGIRFKIDEGTFDARDYQSDNPLGFGNLATKWLAARKIHVEQGSLKQKSWNNLNNYMKRAIEAWGNRNIKEITYADLEDFLFYNKGNQGVGELSSKSRAKAKSVLHDFWQWLLKRRVVHISQLPEFPEVPFELAFRKTIGKETQDQILNELRRISWDVNPRIWIGVKWLSTYFSIRPGELISIKEGQIDIENGIFLLKPEDTKEKKVKMVPMIEENIDLIRSFPRAFPEMPFFRHFKGIGGATPGSSFGPRHLYKWWIKACENLGINGVDLDGGTRHSTVIALGEHFTPEELKHASMHSTNKAFDRYFRVKPDAVRGVYQAGRSGGHRVDTVKGPCKLREPS